MKRRIQTWVRAEVGSFEGFIVDGFLPLIGPFTVELMIKMDSGHEIATARMIGGPDTWNGPYRNPDQVKRWVECHFVRQIGDWRVYANKKYKTA